ERRQPGDRLEQVGLTLPVRSQEGGEAGSEADLGPGVVAEVGQPERADVQLDHPRQLTRTGMSRYRNSACSGLRTSAGFRESTVSISTSSPGSTSMPWSR